MKKGDFITSISPKNHLFRFPGLPLHTLIYRLFTKIITFITSFRYPPGQGRAKNLKKPLKFPLLSLFRLLAQQKYLFPGPCPHAPYSARVSRVFPHHKSSFLPRFFPFSPPFGRKKAPRVRGSLYYVNFQGVMQAASRSTPGHQAADRRGSCSCSYNRPYSFPNPALPRYEATGCMHSRP